MVKQFTINNTIISIIKILSSGSSHIRKISQISGINHVTIINNIKSLEKSGIVSYKITGRNKEYEIKKNKRAETYKKIAKEFSKLR